MIDFYATFGALAKTRIDPSIKRDGKDISDHLFDILNANIFYVGGLDRKNSKEILDLGMERKYVKTPRHKILSYYLILSAMILENQHHQEEFTNYYY